MRVLFDIGHPAHVHYFKFLIKKIEADGGVVKVIAREKEVSHTLLKAFNIHFVSRGKGGVGIIGKLRYLRKATQLVKRVAIGFKPDVFVSFASPYAAKAAYQLRIPHLALDDTEHASFARKFYLKYTTKVLTPDSFQTNLGDKQLRFNGFMEMCYLHRSVYQPSAHVLSWLRLKPGQPFAVLRFVSFQASHDIGHSGMSLPFKMSLIALLETKGIQVFISSEAEIPEKLKKYQLNIPPEEMHDVLYHARCFIGEGATMASECAMLGTPAIYINSLDAGTLQAQEKLGLIKGFRSEEGVLYALTNWLLTPQRKFQTREIVTERLTPLQPPTEYVYQIIHQLNKSKLKS